MVTGMSKVLKLVIAAAVLAVVGLAAVYFLFFSSDSPEEFKPTAVDEPAKPATADVTGSWTVATGSQAGFRVREKLASLPAQSDAVGRTSDVSGTIVIDGTSVTSADFKVELTTLKSDPSEPRRDNKVQGALQTDQFPAATFRLTSPIDIASATTTVKVDATGDLTIHGVTKPVTIPIQATLIDDQLELVGKITFPMADFGITPPSIGGFVTVEDDGALEFKILLEPEA